MEIHRHPALTRMWAPVGQQPEVPAPGKNEKQVVYGGVDYKTGKLTYTLAATKCGAAFLVFLDGAGETLRGPEDHPGVRQWAIPHDARQSDAVAGRAIATRSRSTGCLPTVQA